MLSSFKITFCCARMNILHGGQLVSESQEVDFLCFSFLNQLQTEGVRRPVCKLSGMVASVSMLLPKLKDFSSSRMCGRI